MAFGLLLGALAKVGHTHDEYSVSEKCVIEFTCPNKNRTVRGILSEGISLAVQSTWQSLFSGAAGAALGSQIWDIADSAHQIFKGTTVRKPWFGRKIWHGTNPMHFELPVQFLSYENAYNEVFLPTMALLSFLYPRLEEERETSEGGLIERFFVPGPPINWELGTSKGDTEGDRVEIKMGQFLEFHGCYLTQVQLQIANSFSLAGWPHNVKATVGFDVMDVAYVSHSGSFMEDGFRNQATSLGPELEGVRALGAKAVKLTDSWAKGLSGEAQKVMDGILDAISFK
jgi:hypothetical protein